MKLTLRQHYVYRAKLELPWYANNTMARGRLEEAGFTDVTVYNNGGETWAQGTWPGLTTEVELPDAVKQVWVVGVP